MKKIAIFFALLSTLYFLHVSNIFAATEERSYLLTFRNASTAGPALNTRFVFVFPDDIAPINLPPNINFANQTLTISGPETILPGESWQQSILLRGDGEILNQLEQLEMPYGWRDENFNGTGRTFFRRMNAPNLLSQLRSDPEMIQQIKRVGIPLAVGLGGLGIISLGTSAVSVSATLAFNLAEFFRYLAFGFLRFKKRRPWGTIYNQMTGKTVPGVLVKIFDARLKKLRETQLTDRAGRFGFLVTPGEYFIKIAHRGFQKKQTEVLKINKPEEMAGLNIAIVAASPEAKKSLWLIKLINNVKLALDFINPYVLALGTLLSLVILIILPTVLNYIIFAIYIVLDMLKILLSRRIIKSFGVVNDQRTNKPLDLSAVRIFDANKNWLLNTKITDSSGKFNFLVVSGSYYVTAARVGYEPYHSETVNIKQAEVINFDIKLSGE